MKLTKFEAFFGSQFEPNQLTIERPPKGAIYEFIYVFQAREYPLFITFINVIEATEPNSV